MIAALGDDPLGLVLDAYSRYAGHRLELDESVYRSESRPAIATGRSRTCCGSFEMIEVSPEIAVDLYFRQCAVSVDCRDLAMIASTLANAGVNPVTRERAIGEDVVREGPERHDDVRHVRRCG